MSRTAFDIDLGQTQGRLQPEGFSPVSGEHAFVLGSDEPRHLCLLNPGDHTEVAQDVDCTGIDFIRVRLRLRTPPSLPAGHFWEGSLLVDGVKQAAMVLDANRTRDRADIAANVSKLSGTHSVTFRLELQGGP
jgi:hypothetical protein